MDKVASSAVLEAALSWPCKRRVDYADSADVWTVRFRWTELKPQLQRDLLDGQCMDFPHGEGSVYGTGNLAGC